ncbi:MAG: hypothetical protein R2715_11840 [Ilumatobacteraceae bacterium]
MLVRARSLDEERRVTADAALELANVLATPEYRERRTSGRC